MRFGTTLILAAALFAAPFSTSAVARVVTDSAGRTVTVPDTVRRVFPAGPPASVAVYVLAPEKLAGWTRAPRPADAPYLAAAARALPEIGRLTGGGEVDLGRLVAAKPDLIVDFGTVDDRYRALADRVQAETGIPYVLIDGSLDGTPKELRLLGDILGVPRRGETLAAAGEEILAATDAVVARVPAGRRPKVYLARGPDGLETAAPGSIVAEILARAGAVNAAAGMHERAGHAAVTPEQVAAWAPDTIVTLDEGFFADVGDDPVWRSVPAVAGGRVFLSPGRPFGFVDMPPSVNRLIGLVWLTHLLHPAEAEGDPGTAVRDFYRLFYQVELSDAALAELMGRCAIRRTCSSAGSRAAAGGRPGRGRRPSPSTRRRRAGSSCRNWSRSAPRPP